TVARDVGGSDLQGPSESRLASMRIFPAGTRVGRYEIVRPIGTGGMGIVYAARDPHLDRKIALKLLRLDLAHAKMEHLQSRLLREARAMARVSHPNVAVVHDVGAVEGTVFIAMEYVEGKTLRQWLRQKPRSRAEILDCFIDAGEGLAAAHQTGLVHRDFKP